MKKIALAALGGTLAGTILTTQIAGPLIAQEAEKTVSVYEQLDLFGDIFERIRAQYVEEVDTEQLVEAAINGMLTSLDPHSSYLSAKDFDEMQEQTRGEFGGLGIEVTQEDGFVKVVAPMDGTPADKAGIKAGDFITHVNSESVLGLTLDDAVDKMRGPVGSEIIITVVREGVAEPFDVSIIRDTIKMVAVRPRLVGNTVVLRISTFNDQTFVGVEEGIKKMAEEAGGMDKVNGFVIDLRNNPGGLLNQAIMVSDAFLEKGEITSTRGRDPEQGERFNAEPGDLAQGKPIVVGTKSFGKGSVQTLIPLKGDGAMRLTTARYYTPSGRSIQALGVMPDIVVNQPIVEPLTEEEQEARDAEEARNDRSEADLRGAITNDSMSEDERNQLEADRARTEEAAKLRDEDYQLAYAVDILRGLAAVAPQP